MDEEIIWFCDICEDKTLHILDEDKYICNECKIGGITIEEYEEECWERFIERGY